MAVGGRKISQFRKSIFFSLKKNIYYSYFLTCSVDSSGFFFFFLFFLFPPSVVDVNFIGTKKSN